MFQKILIANRGEIACRVMRTARRLGIATVAVYSAADAEAQHVAMADEAYDVGPAAARQSYLRGDVILEVARRAGAEAIHPGYGFLSENADFAEACAAAGIVFIGPPPAAIRAMGSKSAAKALMEQSGVPLVPGYHGADQSDAVLRAAADQIGYPVLLKASAGGGGKGMRVVEAPDAFAESLDRARGEARASFGDDHMLVERYLTHPRHIEVQVFADTHGTTLSLFERDCSIQRRHQKVIEESPAPFITAAQRQALGDAAVAAARAVNYVGAGTVEFIYEDDRFYFMEMNTRLQVEHPVTEYVTGLDLVEWQLRVASGEALPAGSLRMQGHAIEARICAEDPAHDFRPATGRIALLREPAASPHVRVDGGVREGDRITPYYDSMIAKLIVWDVDRPAALRRMQAALAAYALVGPATNLDLLRGIAADADFAAGGVDTGFIGRHPALLAPPPAPPPEAWAAAVLTLLAQAPATAPADPWSPWAVSDGFRLHGAATASVVLQAGESPFAVAATRVKKAWRLDLPTGPMLAWLSGGVLVADGARSQVLTVAAGDVLAVVIAGRNYAFRRIDPLAEPAGAGQELGELIAPTPARVVSVFANPGDVVTKGQKLLILEAMKVETTYSAPQDGVVEAVHVRPDQLIEEGSRLVSFVVPPP